MKRVFALLLALCVLLSLSVSAYAATAPAVKSAEEFEEMLQKAEGGDADAMATVGTVYYRGNYNAGITRDFASALEWFEKAAEAGNKTVLMDLATIYDKGTAGVRNLDKAYTYYKQAEEAGFEGAKEKTEEPRFAAFHWKDNAALLAGKLGGYETIKGRDSMPLYLDAPVVDCSLITMELAIMDFSGWPFGQYGLFAQDLNGEWIELGRFQIEQFQASADARTYSFPLDQPVSFRALAVVIMEKGMDFTLYHADNFYVDKANLSSYSDTLPAPAFTASEEQFPVISTHVYSSAWVNPYPAG